MKQTSCLNEFIRYASLNVCGMIGLSVYILADTFFISKGMGANGLAALNLAIPIYSFIHGTGLMLGMGGATRYSIFKAQKDDSLANRIFTNVLLTTILFSLIYILLGVFFSNKITSLLGADAAVAEMTNTYLKVILLFAPAFMLNNVILAFVRNDGNPNLSMTAMLAGSLANILFDYIFIFPLGMGIFGAVLATGTAPLISLAILSRHFKHKKHGFHLVKTTISPALILSCVSLGFPSLITEVSSGIVMIIFNKIILSLNGNVGVAAYGVIANLSLVLLSIYNGIAQGIQPIISREFGAGHPDSIRQTIRYGIVTLLAVSAVIYGVIAAFAHPITSVFNSEGNALLQQIAVPGLRLYFTAAPFVGFNIVISSYFTSIGKALPAQLISLLRGIFLIIPMAFILAHIAEITGVWLTFPVTEAVVCILGILFFVRIRLSCAFA